MSMNEQELREHILELADNVHNGLFASRNTLGEAYEYALTVARSFGGGQAAVMTAVQVVVNTIAIHLKEIANDTGESPEVSGDS